MASLQLYFSNPNYSLQCPSQRGLSPRTNLNKPTNLNFSYKPTSKKLTRRPTKISSSSTSSLTPKNTEERQESMEEDPRPLHQIWREIQGLNNWEGLLDPMNSHLRREIIRYGEFAQACYDSLDFDPHSKYCGSCKYSRPHFFESLDMANRGYHMSTYLYATSNINLPNFFQKSKMSRVWSQHANWMGYIAVATDDAEVRRFGRRDIVVAWRGTGTILEWIQVLKDFLRPAHFHDDPSIKIQSGFYDLYTQKENSCRFCIFSAREQVLAGIKRLAETYRGEELSITVTGHSLGAALAILSAYDIAAMKLNVINNGDSITKIPITVFSFSGPRVGNLKFKEQCDELGVEILRVVNVHDKVPTVPGIFVNEKCQYQKFVEETMSFPCSYAHVGVELALDHTHSPFLKPTNDLGCAHNLEAHLHLIDGYHGTGRKFRLATKRDLALVNKSRNLLRSEYGVPPHWRQVMNNLIVRSSDGRWILQYRPSMEAQLREQLLKFAKSLLSGCLVQFKNCLFQLSA